MSAELLIERDELFTEFVKPTQDGLGVTISPDIPWDAWVAAVQGYGAAWRHLGAKREIIQFILGDLYIAGEKSFGQNFSQAFDVENIDDKLLTRVLWVCKEIEPANRHPALSFSHHEAVAGVKDPEIREELLKTAEADKLTVKELSEVRNEKVPKKKGKSKPAKAKAEKVSITDEASALQFGHQVIAFLEKAEADEAFRKWPKERLAKWEPILSTIVKIARRSVIKTHA